MQDNQNPVAVEDVPVVAWARKHGAHASYRRVTDCKLFNDDLPLVRKSDYDARIARLIAHIDAQAEAHNIEVRQIRDVRNDGADDMRREIGSLRDLLKAAEEKSALYECLRKFNPREFEALWTKNVTSGAMFDDLVRAAIANEAKT
jgi:hypothetical protein